MPEVHVIPIATHNHDDAHGAVIPRATSVLGIWAELIKVRLNAMVLFTTAVGFALGNPGAVDWPLLGWTCLGTALAAASASLFNQLFESRRDALMLRTRGRPLPAKQISPSLVFVAAVITGYVGAALLGMLVGLLPAALAAFNIVLYAVLYTPLKPRTTFNTLIGAVCGALPPIIGWTAATGRMDPGAWLLGGLLCVWRGGHAMLPVRDPTGELTAQVVLITTMPLIPLGLSATLLGLAGVWSAIVSLIAGLVFLALAIEFYRARDDRSARRLFLTSITYLPVVLAAMTLDRGPADLRALFRGRGSGIVEVIPAEAPR